METAFSCFVMPPLLRAAGVLFQPPRGAAAQGFASGDLDADAFALRLFLSSGAPMLLAQSFAKNMGLYGERAGALHVVCASADEARRVGSQVKGVIRPMYSSPPRHGAAIAATVLGDAALYAEWRQELRVMSGRISDMRKARRFRCSASHRLPPPCCCGPAWTMQQRSLMQGVATRVTSRTSGLPSNTDLNDAVWHTP